ncbi:hypothetical protein [Streptomyces sp. ITFR-6]|uniref:hypothetical protein n=1 Tax=Streptomyces sp. ITFR-6 TaxID=3075197 RepID=UPI00288BB451|nr:hypothetical protein [Streptomyces sp. ITFR-6]WNI34466.1 hypothetical protein RLT59_38275 [Streptomyces sp. ITFR-6]
MTKLNSPNRAHTPRVSTSPASDTARTTTCATVYGPPQIRPRPPGHFPIISG